MKRIIAMVLSAAILLTACAQQGAAQPSVPAEPEVGSSAVTAEPAKPAAEPEKPAAEPEKPAAEPEKPAAEPEKPAAEPEKPAAEPEKPAAEPATPTPEPEKPAAEPVKPEKPATPKPLGAAKEMAFTTNMSQFVTGGGEVHGISRQEWDDGYVRLTVEYTAPAGMRVNVFDPPDGKTVKIFAASTKGGKGVVTFDIPKAKFEAVESLTVMFRFSDQDRFFAHLNFKKSDPAPSQPAKPTPEPEKPAAPAPLSAPEPVPAQPNPNAGAESAAIRPLGVAYRLEEPTAVGSVEPWGDHWIYNMNISEDLSQSPELALSLTFSDATQFPSEDKLPAVFDQDALIEWGKAPGLDVDLLHAYGFTGKGAVIAYVDQPIPAHEEYAGVKVHYTNNTTNSSSMHGPAVLSLLAGKDIGTAPEAEVYYYAHASWLTDQTTHAECLYQIIEQNKTLPADQRITMVAFSDNIDESEANAQAFRDAVAACEAAGIMVWFCMPYGAAVYLPFSDKNDPENVTRADWYTLSAPDLVFVPTSGRTIATSNSGGNYIYYSNGGLSWTMPYALGIYAIVTEIDPSLTQDDLRKMIVDTAYLNGSGLRLINPVGFVAAALKGVGRTAEAEELLAAQAARRNYLYAVMDADKLSADDNNAIRKYLAAITDATVLTVDAGRFSNAQELYAALQADAARRGGTVAGVQIFGNPDMVPAFRVKYRTEYYDGVGTLKLDEMGFFLTDFFYSNFDNDAAMIGTNYNVLDHFTQGWDVDLIPDWPVARLPLAWGEFAAFLEKYETFAVETNLEQPDLVNFSNPIFTSKRHIDDMGTFLNRMEKEYDLLGVDYRLYGNLDGQYPVTTDVLGGFTKENVAAENDRGIMELLINSHGQRDNIDQAIFVNGQEQRISFLNTKDINTVLDGNPYYLDTWTCNNGYGMSNNLTTTALNGQCVGMFSATAIISNNGVSCFDDVEAMKESNFYYFYYAYLYGLRAGQSRSEAFHTAQQAYALSLLAESAKGIRKGEGNYQFNLCNLLTYHNFGLIEPNAAALAMVDMQKPISEKDKPAADKPASEKPTAEKPAQSQGGSSGSSQKAEDVLLTAGQPVGEPRELKYTLNTNKLTSGTAEVHGCTLQNLDNGCVRISLEYTAPGDMRVSVFSPPNGDVFMMRSSSKGTDRQTLAFDLPVEQIAQSASGVTVKFYDSDSFTVFFNQKALQDAMT